MYREYLMARIDAVIESLPDSIPASTVPVTVKWDLIDWMWGRGFTIADVVRRIDLDTVDYRIGARCDTGCLNSYSPRFTAALPDSRTATVRSGIRP